MAATVVTIAGTALVGAVVTDLYGRLTDDSPETPVTAVVEAAADCPGGRYILPASAIEGLPSWGDLDSVWAQENGGFDTGPIYYLTVQGTGSDAVVLHDLRVVGLQEELAPEEPVYLTKCSGAGDLFARRFDVNLDTAPPRVTALRGDSEEPGDEGVPAPDFPYTVSVTDPEVFWLTIANSDCFCTFTLELRWTSEGRSGVTRIDLGGNPFAVSPNDYQVEATAAYTYFSDGEPELVSP